ncbi:MAG: hypothetical protein ACFCU5_07050 [Pleurocapsa sp.]
MQSSPTAKKNHYRFVCPQLPLAVYREVAAHLRQVDNVEAGLISRPVTSSPEKFDYTQSQIEALWIEYPENLDHQSKQRIDSILDYYARRYHPWQFQILDL